MKHLRIRVVEIRGYCPVYKKGDEFSILDGFKLRTDTNQLLCMHSLASIMPYYVALSKGITPKELGLGKEKAYVQCLDPCKYTEGGTVVMELSTGEARE